jgi:prepilin-type N-terminal cleavage/methylation domain-containing protein
LEWGRYRQRLRNAGITLIGKAVFSSSDTQTSIQAMMHTSGISDYRRASRATGGFTLIELMVVVAIIGILIALLLPAVQQARESGRRISCASNLRQLAIATHSYTDMHRMLPPSGVVDITTLEYSETVDSQPVKRPYSVYDQMSGKMFSWAVLILPFVEETSLYDRFDQSANILQQPNEPQQQSVPTYLCPSDGAQGRMYVDEAFTGEKLFAKGNYAAYVSPFHGDLQLLYPGALIATGQKLSRVIDGTSKTIVFSEVRTRDQLQDERGVWALPWNAASQLSFDMHHDKASAGGTLTGFSPFALYANQTQLPNTLGPNADILVRCPDSNGTLTKAQVEGMPCLQWQWTVGLGGYVSAAPRSNHIGGVNAVCLDGHLTFLSDNIDPFVMANLIDIRDQAVTGHANQ